MDFLDDMKDKAEDLIGDHASQVQAGIEKVADLIDDKTGGKHSDKIDSAADALQGFVAKLDD